MKREDILSLCRKARDVGKVRHEDFADYVIGLERRKRVGGEWVSVEIGYMSVDGKLAMANEDHRIQDKRLDFEPPTILVDNEEQLTLLVSVVSEVYGRRHGIATSRRVGGSPVEREYPWEVAETSAIGRALASMGYGLLPGAGLSSAEDMERVMAADQVKEKERPAYKSSRKRRAASLSDAQKRELLKRYQAIHDVDEKAAVEGLEALFQEQFQHGLEKATRKEGEKMIAALIREQSGSAKEAKPKKEPEEA